MLASDPAVWDGMHGLYLEQDLEARPLMTPEDIPRPEDCVMIGFRLPPVLRTAQPDPASAVSPMHSSPRGEQEARRAVEASPLSPKRLRLLAVATAALRDYHASAVACLQAMASSSEDPIMVQTFQDALGALRIRRMRVLPEAKRAAGRRKGWGVYGDSDPDSATDTEAPVKPMRRRHARYGPSQQQPHPPQPDSLLCEGMEDVLKRLWPTFQEVRVRTCTRTHKDVVENSEHFPHTHQPRTMRN